ncbi:unnamed protein product [Rhizoctonia solani]|uniref:Uncharacterized protein n=1 Tax=Rhizoctonia solani TaxID=456999 RepID=A0A8H3BYI5_9AGAM|nr:unnamed protein product [Rhizoctonia solani]
MSDGESSLPSNLESGAAPAPGVKPSTPSPSSGHTISNAKDVKLTRLAHITDPDELSLKVSQLPRELSGARARFWHPWTGKVFLEKIGNRGSGDSGNARNWTFSTFVTSYCDKFHSDLTPDERCEYEAFFGQKVYNFLYNSTKRNRLFADSDDEDKDLDPSRVAAADIWAKEKPEEYREKLDKYYKEHPGTKQNPGLRRKATFELYDALTDAERTRYKKMAGDAMERIKKGKALEGLEAEKFSKQYPQNLKKLLNKAEKTVGAQTLAILVTKEGSITRNITILSSDGFREFSKSASTTKLLASLKDHIQKTSVNTLVPTDCPPCPCVYPDSEHNDKPSVPELTGLRASDLQDIHRDYWKQSLAYMGGGSRFPWEEIAKDPARWLGGKLPGDFKDPGSHDRNGNSAWLECLLAGQKDNIPPTERIFIRRILTANPIDPSESEEVSREKVTHQGRDVWELTFDKPVTKSHARKALDWPDESLLYAKYIRAGPIAGSYSNPYKLPVCPNTKTHLVIIDGELYGGLMTRANLLAEGKDEVLGLIDAYNEFASHLPAETVQGAWDGRPVPLLFSAKPPTQPPTANFFLNEYLPSSYYQSAFQAQKEGTLSYFEMWIELVLSGKLLSHGPSSTLLGGTTGCIWAVLGVVLVLFNIAYVRGDAKPPFSPPENYDLSRLPGTEWDRVRQWCRRFTEALNESTRVLSPTSPHRLKGAVPVTCIPVEELALGEDPVQTNLLDTNVAQNSSASPKLTKKSTHQKSTRSQAKGKGKERRRARATESESEGEFSSDKDSDSTDYNRKDKIDEDSSEDDPRLGINEGIHSLSTGGWNIKSIRQSLPKDFEPCECPWGDFPNPKVHVNLPDCIAPETLLPPMESAYEELDAALQEWHQSTLDTGNPHVERAYGVSERNNPVLGNPRIGPMYATILTREFVWNFRKAQGESLYPILERLKVASSIAYEHSSAWVEFIESAESVRYEGPDLDVLDELGGRLRAKIAEALWIYDEMVDYAHLATVMAKKMDWFPDPKLRPAPNSPDIRKCAVWCMEWAEATEELEGEMMAHRREYWSDTGRPFEKQLGKPSPYKFGNAIKEEWHQAFEACLALDEAPVPTLSPTPVAASSPNADLGTTDEPATARPEEEPTINQIAQPQKGPITEEMEREFESQGNDDATAKETGPDKQTELTTLDPVLDASRSTTGKVTTSTRGRKPGPRKQVTGITPRETRAKTKQKEEEAQQVIRRSRRKK